MGSEENTAAFGIWANVAFILKQTIRLLAFQTPETRGVRTLRWLAVAGCIFAWIAGVGRYWDHPSPLWWQHFGLSSVAYIFFLSSFLFLIIYPLKPKRWRWISIFAFVGLTSPLAWLYALPVEKFVSPELAISLNVKFLLVVAAWRTALYVWFLWTYGGLRDAGLVAAALAPLSIIIVTLTILNLESGVFEIMAGIARERSQTEQIADARYAVVSMLSVLSILIVPIWLIAYLIRLWSVFGSHSSNSSG